MSYDRQKSYDYKSTMLRVTQTFSGRVYAKKIIVNKQQFKEY